MSSLLVKSCTAGLLVFLSALAPVSRELGPILYRSWDGLCSISPSPGAKPVCSRADWGDPSWQPHGKRIVATSRSGLALFDSNGQLIRALGGKSGGRPTWSPDGRYIYATNGGTGSTILRWDADGRGRALIPVLGQEGSDVYFQMISISPSGRRAAILRRNFDRMLIADVGETKFSVSASVPRGFSYVAQSVWLDDDHLLFVGKKDTNQGELWQLDLRSGATLREGIDGLWLRDFVALSPDGKSVVVTATNGKPVSWDLWQYFLDSRRLVRLTFGTADENVEPSWRR